MTANARSTTDRNAASAWIQRWSHVVAPGGSVLDVACGRGRHLRWFARLGHPVTGVDRNREALAGLDAIGEIVHADIESGPWPFAARTFDAVVVTNYLWRPLLPTLLASVAPGGVLLYETFAVGNAALGRPRNPSFLLQDGELLRACAPPQWQVVAYENGYLDNPPRLVQRIAALRCSFQVDAAAGSTIPAVPLQRRHLTPPDTDH